MKRTSTIGFAAGFAAFGMIVWFLATPQHQGFQTPQPDQYDTSKEKPGLAERRTSDGSILRIEKITSGQKHCFDYEYTESSGNVQQRSICCETDADQLVVWLTRRNAKTLEPTYFVWDSAAIDALGKEVPDQHTYIVQELQPSERSSVGWLGYSTFPLLKTHNGRLTLKVNYSLHEVVEFELLYPATPATDSETASLPEFIPPDELPATKIDGDMAVTLRGLTIMKPHGRRWSVGPRAEVVIRDQPTRDWLVERFGFYDAQTGAPYLDPTWNAPTRLPEQLSSACKLKLGVFKQEHSTFDPEERATIEQVALAPANNCFKRDDALTINDVAVKLAVVAGPGKTSYSVPSNWPKYQDSYETGHSTNVLGSEYSCGMQAKSGQVQYTVHCDLPHLLIQTEAWTLWRRLYVQVTDDRGRTVPIERALGQGDDLLLHFFKPEPDAKSLNLTLIVHNAREFEFFVKPPAIQLFHEMKP